MFPFSFWRSSAAVFNPATLPLTSWLKLYPGSAPWTGAASAGSSGTNPYTTSGSDPTAGTTLNGKATAAFSGAQFLDSTDVDTTMYSASAGSAAFLFNASSLPANIPGAPYEDGNFLTDTNAEVAFGVTTSGLRFTLQTTAFASATITSSSVPSTGAWHLAQYKWDATTIRVRLDSGAWSTTSAGGLVSSAAMISTFGRGYSGASFFTGLLAEAWTSNTTISDANFDNYKSYVNSLYALAL